MEKTKIYQVDAFTDKLFAGNPAAVCLFDKWPEDKVMQNIAAENNLAETAFVIFENDQYHIRWFTPTVEVDLCGHATLAAGYIIIQHLKKVQKTIVFQSRYRGQLSVTSDNEMLWLDFPTDTLKTCHFENEIMKGTGFMPVETLKGENDVMAIFQHEDIIKAIKPDFKTISALDARGLIVTAPGNKVDFVSRFFAPQSGINEDPVTGSAHTSLTPYWSAKMGKEKLSAQQLSQRGGKLQCINKGSRTLIGGNATLYLEGDIYIH
ncbi:MAG TPA: PhzF family phenazine biosynthesis protein [Bacteroidales bacterium]